MVGNNEINL